MIFDQREPFFRSLFDQWIKKHRDTGYIIEKRIKPLMKKGKPMF